ncbi:MAG: fatty acid desaturase [Candidatus Latescibacterota bacterium]
MDDTQDTRRIAWHRTRIDRATLAALNQRSDALGLLQTLGYLSVLTATGAAAWYASAQQAWAWFALALFVHGTCYAFMVNGFHELCHSTVFRTQWLNVFFLHLLSFLGWLNPVHFWTSHQEHHKYTLHPPEDGEVVLPQKLTLKGYLKGGFVNPWGLYFTLRNVVRRAVFGKLQPGWESVLFPPANADGRRRLFRWDRVLLAGHGLLVGVSLYLGAWQLPVLVTLAPFWGAWLHLLCNTTQHIGLQDNVPDFRLCTRTILLGPVVRFLYWHMNYHIEHHMYAAVPCYRLGALHAAIRHELPHCPRGLVAAWRQILPILRRQRVEPDYQFVPELPVPVAG